jgi:hypothetical protein
MSEEKAYTIEELAEQEWVAELQGKFGLPADFFKRLLQEDDWSFVIKLHALLEAVCSDLLVHRLNEPGLINIIGRLELSNKTFGKMAFIKELELLSYEGRRFVASLSEWRNNFVHNVRNCSASLVEIVSKMDSKGLTKFAEDFSPQGMRSQRLDKMKLPGWQDVPPAPTTDELRKRATRDPKQYIWLGGYDLLVEVSDKYGYNEYILYDRALQLAGQYEEDDANDPDENIEMDSKEWPSKE